MSEPSEIKSNTEWADRHEFFPLHFHLWVVVLISRDVLPESDSNYSTTQTTWLPRLPRFPESRCCWGFLSICNMNMLYRNFVSKLINKMTQLSFISILQLLIFNMDTTKICPKYVIYKTPCLLNVQNSGFSSRNLIQLQNIFIMHEFSFSRWTQSTHTTYLFHHEVYLYALVSCELSFAQHSGHVWCWCYRTYWSYCWF